MKISILFISLYSFLTFCYADLAARTESNFSGEKQSVLDYEDIVFVILPQQHPYHKLLADRLKQDIIHQARQEDRHLPIVKSITSFGSWTILPLIKNLYDKYGKKAKWIVFCDEYTAIRLNILHKLLAQYDHNQEIWIGHGLRDMEPTIIHHFFHKEGKEKFLYPNFASGFAISIALIKSMNQKLQNNQQIFESEFSIDPAYELAKFIWDESNGSKLTDSKSFCVVSDETCATYPRSHDPCTEAVSRDSIYFAVKTYHKFHTDRVPIVKKTWGKYATNLMFFSNKNDTALPSIDLGIENTDHGHCAKTMGIISHLHKDPNIKRSIKWVIIADDDTILSVSRIGELLSCYGNKDVALGERYGYNMLTSKGYEYITGGGGIVLSVDLIEKLANCTCPTPSSPDDMWLGVCLEKIKVPIIHSPLFHQARPADYALEYLAPHRPVSFHKHWMIDPIKTYKQWFENDDFKLTLHSKILHGEL